MAGSDAVLSALPITLMMIRGDRKGRGDAEQRPAEGCLPSAEYYSVLVQVQQISCCRFHQFGGRGQRRHVMMTSHRSAAAAAANVTLDLEMRDCAAGVGEDLR
jgi:hypothetical protein